MTQMTRASSGRPPEEALNQHGDATGEVNAIDLKDIMEHPAEASPIPQQALPPVTTWQYRLWLDQAKRLYRTSEAQRQALLHHLDIRRRHAPTADMALWYDELARALAAEVPYE